MADLISLADARDQLNITSTQYDAELVAYISAASALVEDLTGPMSVQTFTEVIDTHAPVILLTYRPVASIVSIAALYSTWPSFTAADVSFDPDAGTVWRLDQGTIAGAYRVTYTAGRTTVPTVVNVATRIVLQHLWTTQRGGSSRPGRVDEQPPGMHWDDIPNRARMLLRPYLLPPNVS